MTREEAINNLNMISVAFVEPVTKEQRKLIDDTFDNAIKALEQEPKIGYWIHRTQDGGCFWEECSVCHTERAFSTKYCPDCGTYMYADIRAGEAESEG